MRKWEHSLGIRDGERDLVIRIAVVFAVTQSTHALGANSADALFFLRYGVEQLPLVILLSGLAVMGALIVHVAGLGRIGARVWLPTITAICGVWAVAEWAFSSLDRPVVYPVIWISTQVLIMVTFTVMWNAAGVATTTRQAKRLYPIFASAGVAGAIVGNLMTGPLAALIGTQTLLAVQGVALLGSALMLRGVSHLFVDDTSELGHSFRADLAETIGTIGSSRLLRLAALVTFALSALFFLVVFPFNEAVAGSLESEAEVAGFLGLFASLATGATFLVSLLVTNRLFARFGIVVSLMLVPIVYLGGFGLWAVSFTLATAALVRGLQWVVVNAIGGSATTALFNVVTGRRRGQVLALMTAIPGQLGVATGGAILLFSSTLGDLGQLVIGLLGAMGALVGVVVMRSAYVEALVSAIRRGLVGVFDSTHEGLITPFDGDSVQILLDDLSSPRPEERLIAVSALSRLGSRVPGGLIEPLMGDEDPRVRSAAFDALCTIEPDRIVDHVSDGLADRSPDIRKRAVGFIPLMGDNQPRSVTHALLADPDPSVRTASAILVGGSEGSAVIDALLESGQPTVLRAVLDELTSSRSSLADPRPFLNNDDPDVRLAAVLASPFADVNPNELSRGLDDRSLRVRQATADVLADSGPGRELLIEALESGSVSSTEVALRALTPIDRFTLSFLGWAGREAARASMLAVMRLGIISGPPSPSTEFLAGVLSRRSKRLSEWVLLAMTTTDNTAVMSIVARGVASDDPETRDQAVEAVEVVGDRSVTVVLTTLLDAELDDQNITQEEALRQLSGDFDPWLRVLAWHCIGDEAEVEAISRQDLLDTTREGVASSGEMPADSIDTISLVDRLVALHRVPMFSELDPEDLQQIAIIADEIRYSPDELVYRAGDQGTEMMVIVDGEAVVSLTQREDRREVARYTEGEHVGELALLQGAVRSADVHAGADGLHGLTVGKIDLISILQERPLVALAMLSTLAERLASQT